MKKFIKIRQCLLHVLHMALQIVKVNLLLVIAKTYIKCFVSCIFVLIMGVYFKTRDELYAIISNLLKNIHFFTIYIFMTIIYIS